LHLREFFARGKAWRDILVWSSPRHLGERIPITGKSNSS
jgi:vancomycin permeability regulator SanA